jgi:hypothetical protein
MACEKSLKKVEKKKEGCGSDLPQGIECGWRRGPYSSAHTSQDEPGDSVSIRAGSEGGLLVGRRGRVVTRARGTLNRTMGETVIPIWSHLAKNRV